LVFEFPGIQKPRIKFGTGTQAHLALEASRSNNKKYKNSKD
jgi:hypothetical protein